MPVSLGTRRIAAMLDSGSNVNLMSESLFKSLPANLHCVIVRNSEQEVVLASNHTVSVTGCSVVKLQTPSR